jgi:hypothetical protein
MDYTNYSLGVVLESPLLIIFYGEDFSQISLQFLSAADLSKTFFLVILGHHRGPRNLLQEFHLIAAVGA